MAAFPAQHESAEEVGAMAVDVKFLGRQLWGYGVHKWDRIGMVRVTDAQCDWREEDKSL